MVALSSVCRVHWATAGKAWQMSSWERGGFVLRTTVVRMSMAVCRRHDWLPQGRGGRDPWACPPTQRHSGPSERPHRSAPRDTPALGTHHGWSGAA